MRLVLTLFLSRRIAGTPAQLALGVVLDSQTSLVLVQFTPWSEWPHDPADMDHHIHEASFFPYLTSMVWITGTLCWEKYPPRGVDSNGKTIQVDGWDASWCGSRLPLIVSKKQRSGSYRLWNIKDIIHYLQKIKIKERHHSNESTSDHKSTLVEPSPELLFALWARITD